MRAVFGLVLIVGLGLAGFAVYMVKGYFDQQAVALAEQRAVAEQAVPTVELIAMNRTINYGEILTKEDVSFIRYAEPFLPEGVFLTAEELFPEDREPRIVLRQMDAMEPVLASKVTEPGEDAGLASRLGKGIRAFAITSTPPPVCQVFCAPATMSTFIGQGKTRPMAVWAVIAKSHA